MPAPSFLRVNCSRWKVEPPPAPPWKGGAVYILGFSTHLTDELIQAKNVACSGSRTGDLCQSNPLARLKQFISAAGPSFRNFSTPDSDGTCAGWSETVLKIMYLTNFIGENKATLSQSGCLSAIAGMSKSFVCNANQSACRVTWHSFVDGPNGGTRDLSSQFAMCAYKTKETDVPENLNLLRMLGIKTIKCDGVENTIKGFLDNSHVITWQAVDESKDPLKP
jgi:hypothetical protein